jgi:hypothetical protein
MRTKRIDVRKMGPADIDAALPIVEEVYLKEKGWIPGVAREMLEREFALGARVSWFLAEYEGAPAGLLRLYYDPELKIPEEYEASFVPGFEPEKLASIGKFVEIGRFMIRREYRGKLLVSLRLMRAAVKEVIERDYTHFITDVFEGEATSPFNFHTRLLGFEVIGRHLRGELNCSCARIILSLDILKAYKRLKKSRSKTVESITGGLDELFEKRLREHGIEEGVA